MNQEEKQFLDKINEYAEKVMPDIDPRKVRISEQIDKLRPILQELAMIEKKSVEDIFIKYMDLATEASIINENKLNEDFKDIFNPLGNK
ncbi:MAG: hypothetical protein ACRC7V_01155 [Lachnospiraceae bacterium]